MLSEMNEHEELDLFRRIEGIGSSLDLQAVLDRLLAEGLKTADYDRGDIRLLDRNSGELVLWSKQGQLTSLEPKRVSANEGISGRALREVKPQTVPDVQCDADYLSLLEKYKGTEYERFLRSFRSAVKVPILGSDGPIGVFCAHSPGVNTFSDDKVVRLEKLMRRAAWAVANAQVHEEAAYIVRIRHEIDRAAASAKDLNTLLSAVLEMTSDHLGCTQGLIRLVDEKTRLLIRAAAQGLALETIPLTMEMGAGIVGQVADTGKSVLVGDTENHTGFRQRRDKYSRPEYKKFLQGIKSMVAAAFCAEGQVIGVLMAHKGHVDGFGQNEQRILEQIAGYASLPVRNAMNHQTAHSLQDMTAKFQSLLEDLSDESKALNDVLTYAMELTGCRAGHISLLDSLEIKPVVAAGLLADDLPTQQADVGIEGRALRTGEIQLVPDPPEDRDFQQFLLGLPKDRATRYRDLYDVLVVPLVAGGVKYGVISLHSINPNAQPAIIGSAMEAFGSFAAMLVQKCRFLQDRKHNARLRDVYRKNMEKVLGFGDLVGDSQAAQELREQIDKHSHFDTTVLLLGEPGVGKNLVAKLIHESSARSANAFWEVDCAGMASSLAEIDLFGADRGAYTGRDTDCAGAFEVADGGTLFLNEIGDADLVIQKKLLRFLDSREFQRLGSNRIRRSDVRIVAATNKDVRRMVKEGTFRKDLWDRIIGCEVEVPPLRERRRDILPLADQFLGQFLKKFPGRQISLDEGARRVLNEYGWPGNVRELRRVIESLVNDSFYSGFEVIDRQAALKALPSIFVAPFLGMDEPRDCPRPSLRMPPASSPESGDCTMEVRTFASARDAFDRNYHENLLRRTYGDVSEAANMAGESEKNFRRKMKRYEISAEAFRMRPLGDGIIAR